MIVYGLAWGIVNWGFIAFLPTFLRSRGFGAGASSYLLFLSAFVAIPATVLVAWTYGKWSSRKSMICLRWRASRRRSRSPRSDRVRAPAG